MSEATNIKFLTANVEIPSENGGRPHLQQIAKGFFHNDKQGVSILIPPGVTVTGKLVLLPITENNENPQSAPRVGYETYRACIAAIVSDKTHYHRVGIAFPHSKGEGINVLIPEGITVSGTVFLFPEYKNKSK